MFLFFVLKEKDVVRFYAVVFVVQGKVRGIFGMIAVFIGQFVCRDGFFLFLLSCVCFFFCFWRLARLLNSFRVFRLMFREEGVGDNINFLLFNVFYIFQYAVISFITFYQLAFEVVFDFQRYYFRVFDFSYVDFLNFCFVFSFVYDIGCNC